MAKLQDKKVAFLATDGVEQVELTEPWKAVEKAGGTPELISLESGEIQGFDHLDKADTFDVDTRRRRRERRGLRRARAAGRRRQSRLPATDEDAVRFVRAFFEAGKPVGVICHGPWTLVEADVVRGRTLTSWPSAARPTSATPAATGSTRRSSSTRASSRAASRTTCPAFCAKAVEEICEGRHEGQALQAAGAAD